MAKYYTDERQAQILLELLKQHGVRKIVVSPGATNIPIAGSVQYDPFFEVYSSVDERSAAYIACGLAEESGEPVAISCTGATASRNYMPGLTEAFYRKLPVVAITSFNGSHLIGNLVPQNIDRSAVPNDVVKTSVNLPIVNSDVDETYCNLQVNRALLAMTKNGGGPVHINLTTTYLGTFDTKVLPVQRVIKRLNQGNLPNIDAKKIGIFIGAHRSFTVSETRAIDDFCEKRNAVVLCDHTSGYKGAYRVQSALVCANINRLNPIWSELLPEVVFHLGEVSGDYPGTRVLEECAEVWRISEDGEVRDRGGKLKYIFEGSIEEFLLLFSTSNQTNHLFRQWKEEYFALRNLIPDLPYSNTWIASELSNIMPENSYLHLGILNTLRNWNFFNVDSSINVSSNVGGFGIDGCVSTLFGASLVDKNKTCFGIVGDLAFFYDVNVIANRHIQSNIRLLIINNGCGTEFKNFNHFGSQFQDESNDYIAAGGHFGSNLDGTSRINSSEIRVTKSLASSWADQLGFKYISAKNKSEFLSNKESFLNTNSDVPIIFECFTDSELESNALEIIGSLSVTTKQKFVNTAKDFIPKSIKSQVIGYAKKVIK